MISQDHFQRIFMMGYEHARDEKIPNLIGSDDIPPLRPESTEFWRLYDEYLADHGQRRDEVPDELSVTKDPTGMGLRVELDTVGPITYADLRRAMLSMHGVRNVELHTDYLESTDDSSQSDDEDEATLTIKKDSVELSDMDVDVDMEYDRENTEFKGKVDTERIEFEATLVYEPND